MKLAVVCCLHGNEPYGLEVVKRLPASVQYFIGNENALEKNVRFIDVDLNRCFPGDPEGNYEERRAVYLVSKLKDFDYIIDLHSTSNECPIFGIVTRINKNKIFLAESLGLNKLVLMPRRVAKGKALIDYVKCGISLEVGPHNRKENSEEILSAIRNLLNNPTQNKELEIFIAGNEIRKEGERVIIQNFQEIKKGELIMDGNKKQYADEDFIAILVNEAAYKNILCIKAKRMPLLNLYKHKGAIT